MRTTLDIDPVVLSAARARAQAERISMGRAVSDLALAGLSATTTPRHETSGFPVLAGNPDHMVTDEVVSRYRDDDPVGDDAP
ncbi:MAG: DUF2191 domain-containing protein [Tessaracoccus sp.]